MSPVTTILSIPVWSVVVDVDTKKNGSMEKRVKRAQRCSGL